MAATPAPRPTLGGGRESGRGDRGVELGLVLALALLAFAQLDLAPLVTMEGIVGAGARTMLREGGWAVPRLYGDLYTFKPPLAYWLAAGSMQLLGEGVLALRLPFALAAVLGPWLGARLLGRVVGFERAAWAALAAASGVLVVQKVRIAEFDGLLGAALGVAMLACAVDLTRERASLGLWLTASLAFTLGFLAKGLPAVGYFVPGLLAAAWTTGRLRRLVDPRVMVASLLALVVIGAWVLAAYQDAGSAAFAQPLGEGSERALAWSLERVGGVLLAPLAVLLLFAPWSLALPVVWLERRARGAAHGEAHDPAEEDLLRALLSFVVAGTLVHMVVPRTSLRYLLPLATPVGALVALHLTGMNSRGLRGRLFGLLPLLSGGVALAAALGAFGTDLPLRARLAALTVSAPAVFLAVRSVRARRWLPSGGLGVPALAACAFALFGAIAYGTDLRRAERRRMDETAEELRPHLVAGETLFVDWFDTHSNLHFLLDHPWRRFALDGDWPGAGSLLLLTARQAEEVGEFEGDRVQVVTRTESGRTHFVLARVLKG